MHRVPPTTILKRRSASGIPRSERNSATGCCGPCCFSFPDRWRPSRKSSARIGRVTGLGIAGNIRRHYPRPFLYGTRYCFCWSPTFFSIGVSDIGAMGAAAALVCPGPVVVFIVLAGGICLALQILIPYTRYVKYLKWLTLSLFAYVVTSLLLHEPRWPANPRDFPAQHFPPRRIPDRTDCDSRDDGESLPVLLAGFRRGRRRYTSPKGTAAQECAGTSAIAVAKEFRSRYRW